MIELEKCALYNDRSMEKELVLHKEGDNGGFSSQPTLFVLTLLFAAGWKRQIVLMPTMCKEQGACTMTAYGVSL